MDSRWITIAMGAFFAYMLVAAIGENREINDAEVIKRECELTGVVIERQGKVYKTYACPKDFPLN